ncbi:hypothetical protein HDU98_011664 [Podochytrium sp. JEL0797]|nr:hypothetical protein HDU98_011664 [Podochytrium sp. JEL0797]
MQLTRRGLRLFGLFLTAIIMLILHLLVTKTVTVIQNQTRVKNQATDPDHNEPMIEYFAQERPARQLPRGEARGVGVSHEKKGVSPKTVVPIFLSFSNDPSEEVVTYGTDPTGYHENADDFPLMKDLTDFEGIQTRLKSMDTGKIATVAQRLSPKRNQRGSSHRRRISSKVIPTHDYPAAHESLTQMLQAWSTFSQQNGILWWIQHGPLLGWFWNGKLLPWDMDLDIQMSTRQVMELVKWNGTLIHGRFLIDMNPNLACRTMQENNVIDARVVDTLTGYMIDITAVTMVLEAKGIQTLYCKSPHPYQYEELMPLRETLLAGIIVWRPRAALTILKEEYQERAMLIQLSLYNQTLVEGRFLIDVNPNIVLRSYQYYNTIDARFIDTATGYLIDITGLSHIPEVPEEEGQVVQGDDATRRNYSSWSMRPLLFVRKHKLPVQIQPFNLTDSAKRATINAKVPTGCLPALSMTVDGKEVVIPDSLAIVETLGDLFGVAAWPADVVTRAKARAVAAEMHSGFSNIRNNMPCNLRGRYPPREWSDATNKEIRRMCQVWESARAEARQAQNDDGWLFGRFSAADAMFFPIVTRFLTYGVAIDASEFPLALEYWNRVLRDETVREMYQIGETEEWGIEHYDAVYPGMKKETL